MTTGTLTGNERFGHSETKRKRRRAHTHLGRFGLGTTAGVVAVLVSAWGGIVSLRRSAVQASAGTEQALGTGAWRMPYWR